MNKTPDTKRARQTPPRHKGKVKTIVGLPANMATYVSPGEQGPPSTPVRELPPRFDIGFSLGSGENHLLCTPPPGSHYSESPSLTIFCASAGFQVVFSPGFKAQVVDYQDRKRKHSLTKNHVDGFSSEEDDIFDCSDEE